MSEEKEELILWEECKKVFLSANNEQLKDLLRKIIEIVINNYDVFCEKADLEYLDFIVKIDVDEYLLGTNGDDFELRLKSYSQQNNISVEDIWKILSQLIWDLIVPVTEKVCPFCHCDNLVLMVDKEKEHIYESCENCFWISENGIQIMRPNDLLPANKEVIKWLK